jgi:HSP20 family protein
LSRDQIDIHVEEYRVVVRGARTAVPGGDISSEQFHRVERGHGRFSRAFTLPEPIDVERVIADLKDGVLTIRLAKATDRGARRIDVA